MMEGSDSANPVGVYGKLGSQPDFFRANAGEFSQAGFDRFFQDVMEALRGEGTTLPEAPTAFLLAAPGAPQAFMGSFARSADSAGRAFPLVVFAKVPASDLIEGLPYEVAAQFAFIHAAGQVAAAEADGPEVLARVHGLTLAAPGSVEGVSTEMWAGETAEPLLAALNGSAAALGYALRTLASACDQAVKAGIAGRGTPITVDAPAPTPMIRSWWLELIRRRLHWRDASPSALWTDGPDGRLLVTLGNPSASAVSYLCNPRHRAQRFWPLRTTVAAAIDSAMTALTPDQRRRVETRGTSLAELLTAFG